MTSIARGPRVGFLRRLYRAVVPWVCSTSCHLALLGGLVSAYEWADLADAPGGIPLAAGSDPVVTWHAAEDSDSLEPAAAVPSGRLDRRVDDAAPAQSLTRDFVGDTTIVPEADRVAGLLDASREIQLAGYAQAAASATSDVSAALVQRDQDDERATSGSRSLPSGYVRTGVFGASGEGRKFVYVFDRSASMDGHGGAPLAAAKRELLASLNDLDQTHQFQIIFYNERPRVFNPTGVLGRLVFGTDQNKNLAEKFVGSITADGATQHEEALAMALKMAPDVIFFLTDADEPRMSGEQLARLVRLNKGTAINAIEFGFGAQVERDNFLVKLAKQNAGQHVYVDVSKLAKPRGK
jgi:hypothetical protein